MRGECYDEDLLANLVPAHLPPKVLLAREVAT